MSSSSDLTISAFLDQSYNKILAEYQKIDQHFSPDGKYQYGRNWKMGGQQLCDEAIQSSDALAQELVGKAKECFTVDEENQVKQLAVRTGIFSNYFKQEKNCAEAYNSTYEFKPRKKEDIAFCSLLALNIGILALNRLFPNMSLTQYSLVNAAALRALQAAPALLLAKKYYNEPKNRVDIAFWSLLPLNVVALAYLYPNIPPLTEQSSVNATLRALQAAALISLGSLAKKYYYDPLNKRNAAKSAVDTLCDDLLESPSQKATEQSGWGLSSAFANLCTHIPYSLKRNCIKVAHRIKII